MQLYYMAFVCSKHCENHVIVIGLHVFTEDHACTWQCTREVEDTLVELADGTPVIEEHLYHLPSTHRLR